MESRKSSGRVITCILVGAGMRGHGYASYALRCPENLKVVAVAEPRDFQRNREMENHKISKENVCTDWRPLSERAKFADCVIICTVDRDHKAPAVAFANKGYHILLEKPMAVSEAECREVVTACKSNNVKLSVSHVLRYVPWAQRIEEIIQSGRIGDVVNIQHTEPVGFWHFAHSYVRGNWHNEAESSSSLLAKCCHDVDLIKNWMGDKKCTLVSSFGHLTHFKQADKPAGASSRCVTCPQDIESMCPYSAKRFYLDQVKHGNTGWPVSVLADIVDIESITAALQTGPYGRCVYQCDNDVMSHQVVNFQFEGGATVSLTMVAFSKKICAREVKVYGTKGEIFYDDNCGKFEVFDFLTSQTTTEDVRATERGGHGGGDFYLINSFVSALKDKDGLDSRRRRGINKLINTQLIPHRLLESNPYLSYVKKLEEGQLDQIQTGADDTLASHLLVFAAEKARKEKCVVHINPDGSF